jgi:hypothetical protein
MNKAFDKKQFIAEKKKEFNKEYGVCFEITNEQELVAKYLEQTLNEAITKAVESLRPDKELVVQWPQGETPINGFGYDRAYYELNKKIDDILK